MDLKPKTAPDETVVMMGFGQTLEEVAPRKWVLDASSRSSLWMSSPQSRPGSSGPGCRPSIKPLDVEHPGRSWMLRWSARRRWGPLCLGGGVEVRAETREERRGCQYCRHRNGGVEASGAKGVDPVLARKRERLGQVNEAHDLRPRCPVPRTRLRPGSWRCHVTRRPTRGVDRPQ